MKLRLRRGQSITEMALMLPVLVVILFGIIDFSYIIFANSAVERAARLASEEASKTPPDVAKVGINFSTADSNFDSCVANVKLKAKQGAEGTPLEFTDANIDISYPSAGSTGNSIYAASPSKAVGTPIQVTVTYQGKYITPLARLLNRNGTYNVKYTSRRSILNADTTGYC